MTPAGADAIRRVDPQPGMSQATRRAGTVHVSGQVAWGDPGDVIGVDDTRAQAEQVFRNLERVLSDAGAELADVVKLTCFLTPDADFAAYASVKATRFPVAGPASSTVVVAALLDPRLLLEVEAVAIVRTADATANDGGS